MGHTGKRSEPKAAYVVAMILASVGPVCAPDDNTEVLDRVQVTGSRVKRAAPA